VSGGAVERGLIEFVRLLLSLLLTKLSSKLSSKLTDSAPGGAVERGLIEFVRKRRQSASRAQLRKKKTKNKISSPLRLPLSLLAFLVQKYKC
jgi:hypothetical protein